MTFIVTAYCACALCCGRANQPTASGVMPAVGITVAAPRSMTFGTVLRIEGLGTRVVQDRTARRFDGRIDVFMGADKEAHKRALQFGKRNLRVQVLQVGKKKTATSHHNQVASSKRPK